MVNKFWSKLIYAIFGLIFLSAAIFFIHKGRWYNNKLIEFEKREVSGRIINLKKLTKGFYAIKLSSEMPLPNLRIGWEIEEYNIQIGDSVSKEANSKLMTFYKFKNGAYEKCCEYEIGM